MEIILAGFNIDRNLLNNTIESFRDIRNFSNPGYLAGMEKDEVIENAEKVFNISDGILRRDNFTPETISAAYARISRDPLPVYELRKRALKEVDKAKKSNRSIIFGLGHSSVAEHAVFNFDFIGLSRLAVEEIQKFRLCSYTEKSQRYIKIDEEYIVPHEINRSDFLGDFLDLVKKQNKLYLKLFERLKIYFESRYKHQFEEKEFKSIAEGSAKEDARYALSLATTSQMGATLNARNLEYMIAKLLSSGLTEVRTFAEKLFEVVDGVAPSLIKYTKTRPYFKETENELKVFSEKISDERNSKEEVVLLSYDKEGDDKLCAALLFSVSKMDYKTCFEKVKKMAIEEKLDIIKTSLKHAESYDSVLREFETIDLTFELVISSSAFAQLKRHRMATIISQEYDPELGYTIPESIKDIGMEKDLVGICDLCTELFNKSKKQLENASNYILSNAHRKRVLFKINAREMYHVSRLREDIHAQWDIRHLSAIMSEKVKEKMPLTFILLGGKDRFEDIYRKIYNE